MTDKENDMEKAQIILEGRGTIQKLPELMDRLSVRRPLIVGRSQASRLCGLSDPLSSAPVFSSFHSNPDLTDAQDGADAFRQFSCDSLISVGGGSSIDTAKAIRVLLASENIERIAASDLPEELPVPQIAIPGTAGSGSEATQFAVVYWQGRKISLDHPSLRPEGVILDSGLLATLPDYHRKSCALDALSQGIESYWCRKATEESRVHAYLAILGVLDNLKAYLQHDSHAADELLHASYQSGKAIQMTRTTAAHALSYALTKKYGIAHGHACMMTLPCLWELMLEREVIPETLKTLSSLMRLGDPRLAPMLIQGLFLSLSLPSVPRPDQQEISDLAASVNIQRLNNHPMSLTQEELMNVYRKAFTPPAEPRRRLCLDLWNYYGEGKQ